MARRPEVNMDNLDPDTEIDWGDDDDDEEEEVNTAQPFTPGAGSTPYQPQGATAGPYHGGEEHELSEFGDEQSAISDTTFLLAPEQRERAWNATTTFYPDASATDLEAFYDPKTKRLMVKMAGAGKKAYLLLTKEGKQGHLRENPKVTVEIKKCSRQTCRRKQNKKKKIKRNNCKKSTSDSRITSKRRRT